jgi:hypothetical protein
MRTAEQRIELAHKLAEVDTELEFMLDETHGGTSDMEQDEIAELRAKRDLIHAELYPIVFQPTPELMEQLGYQLVPGRDNAYQRTTKYLDGGQLTRRISWSFGIIIMQEQDKQVFHGMVPTQEDFMRVYTWLGFAWRDQGEEPADTTPATQKLMAEHLLRLGYALTYEGLIREYTWDSPRGVTCRVSFNREYVWVDYVELLQSTVFVSKYVPTAEAFAELLRWVGFGEFCDDAIDWVGAAANFQR